MSKICPSTSSRVRSTRTSPAGWKRLGALLGLLLASFALVGCGPELGPIAKLAAIASPGLPEVSDPSVLRVDSQYYVYGSNNNLRAPVTETLDINRYYTIGDKNRITHEGMPIPAPWAAKPNQLWAPTVGQFGSRWVMFFAADRRNPPQPQNPQCIGRAWANSPSGPFVAEGAPFSCGLDGVGGALDPQLFTDPVGQNYLIVAFGNTETPLRSIPLDGNANASGGPSELLSRQHPWEYHFIEQPAMTYDYERGNFLLSYSAGYWFESSYSTGIARCSTPTGPCTSDPSGPWISSSNGRSAPGGLSFFTDTTGRSQTIFSTFQAGWETPVGGRGASVMPLTLRPAVGVGDVVK